MAEADKTVCMEIHNLQGRSKTGYTSWGCIWERGRLSGGSRFVLENEAGTKVPVQSRVTAWWPDGSVKWTAHTADAALVGERARVTGFCPGEGSDNFYGAKEYGQMPVRLEETAAGWTVCNSYFSFFIPRQGKNLLEGICAEGRRIADRVDSVLLLEHRRQGDYGEIRETGMYVSRVRKVSVAEKGPLRLAVKFEGIHVLDRSAEQAGGQPAGQPSGQSGELREEWAAERIPFAVYLRLGAGEKTLRFTYTFFYDGDEERDFLKGLGLRVLAPMRGEIYNRHVKFEGDSGCVHEAAVQLLGGKKFSMEIYKEQMEERLLADDREEMQSVKDSLPLYPVWDRYELCQDSAQHFSIRKKLRGEEFCFLDTLHGNRCPGGAAFGCESGSLLFGIRDFWHKYPSGYTFRGLGAEEAEGILWIYSPQAESMDFRHYTDTGYSQVYYEGYPWKGADPRGIACTSELAVGFCPELIPTDEELHGFRESVDKPAQYVGTPEYYHARRAFGYWSLISRETPVQSWLEDQLDRAVDFYLRETEQRNWYGLFDYGDVMHAYDIFRHCWRYDMGGFAWDNTELVPTYWLWYAFLRSGREDVFSFGESLTRHASEVDVYHFGPLKGLGSRHNVRHWGCPCKEIRIAMAGHNRFYYFLTGDYRLGDVMDEFADVEDALLRRDPIGEFYKGQDMEYPTHARSGPDWSSLCANWMTKWERHQDREDLRKIQTGIGDIKKTPLRLISGPDYEFDPETCHLRYIGEVTTGGTHLQICMGAAQIWLELSDLLGDGEWTEMLEEYGRFYFLSGEKKLEESKGIIGKRGFTLPMLAAGIGAFAAFRLGDERLADSVWRQLFGTVRSDRGRDGFAARELPHTANRECLREIPWISTNTVAQWCLNTVMSLEFIKDRLPESLEEADRLVREGAKAPYRGDIS